MHARHALAVLTLLVACGAAPTKEGVTKSINLRIDDPVLGAVIAPTFFLRPDANGPRGMELFEKCTLPKCMTQRELRDLGLIAVEDAGFDRGLSMYTITFTEEGRRYREHQKVGELQAVRLGRYRVKEVTKIRTQGEDEATVYFTMQFTDTTPFYRRVEQLGFVRIRTEPIERVAHFIHNGKRWKLKEIGDD